jgi:hypothetical protein
VSLGNFQPPEVRRKAGEFGQKAGELDDKLTCSKPIRNPLLTQVWDKAVDTLNQLTIRQQSRVVYERIVNETKQS